MKSLSHSQAKLLRSLAQKKFRDQTGEFLLEGVRLCEEALASPLVLTQMIVAHEQTGHPLIRRAEARNVPVFSASRTQFEQFCDSRTPQGLALVAKIPEPAVLPAPGAGRLFLALDRLADPGNVGTILRTARWFGVTDVILSADCADVFSPKVVRSSMGAVCYLNCHAGVTLTEFARHCQEQNGQIVVLTMRGETLEHFQPDPDRGILLIIGSEARGVNANLIPLGKAVTIQSKGSGESLNAALAAGIALWVLNRSGQA